MRIFPAHPFAIPLALSLLLLASCNQEPEVAVPMDVAPPAITESQRINAWFDEQFEEQLDFSPQWRTQLGDKKDYDKLGDASEQQALIELEWLRNSVAMMEAEFDYKQLDDEAKTSYDLWLYSLHREERGWPFRHHSYLIGRGGPHASLPNFMINFHRVDTVEDMRAYNSRVAQIDDVMHQYLERAQQSAAEGIRQPRFNYQFAMDEIDRVLTGAPFTDEGSSPLWTDANAKVDHLRAEGLLSDDNADELLAQTRDAMVNQMQPAYADVRTWLEQDMNNASDEAQGVWALPDGDAYYDNQLAQMTTVDLTADEIHKIGLTEVARIRGEMEGIKERVGFGGTLQEFFIFMRDDPQFYFPNTDEGRQAYIDLAEEYLDGIAEQLPNYFGILPKADLVVRRVEAFREQPGAAQHYFSGTPDGSRPGIFYAHLSDMTMMPRYQLEDIAYHEGNPGHHMQISIAQELEDIPRFRTQYGYTAFSEGWGLYAESLGKDMGFFEDPYSDFGRLSGEIWRAIRLVVDTGIHSKHWTQEQAVQYFMDNSPQPEGAIRSEIQRYLTSPGQATAYKIGMLKFQELRAKAKDQLGDKFDIREFHDTVLGGGSLPLPVLEVRVDRYIAAKNM